MTDQGSNPYHPANGNDENTAASEKKRSRALKYIAHGVYLQIFFGLALLAVSMLGNQFGKIFSNPSFFGVFLIGLSINSLAYIHRYTRTLK
ncbi:MAG: hypothetical protein AB8B91_19165 [Rubripirellula sp.]